METNDRLVTRYLLGALPPEEAERLDELSIADDEFASRVSAVEKELVDGYVRGGLASDVLQRFRAVYLASPTLRQKVVFAESFLPLADQAEPPKPKQAPARFPQWALAAAACLLAGIATLLLDRFPQRVAKPDVAPRHEVAVAPPAPARLPRTPTVLAIVLRPQLRGAGSISAVQLPPGTDQAVFHLELESDEFGAYRAGLRNAATDRTVWSSGLLRSAVRGEARTVSVNVPGSLFENGTYALELSGVAAGHEPEFIGAYPFRVTR